MPTGTCGSTCLRRATSPASTIRNSAATVTANPGAGSARGQTHAFGGATVDVRARRRRPGDICSVCIVGTLSKAPSVALLKFPDSPGDIFPHNANPFDAITNLTADLPRRLLT